MRPCLVPGCPELVESGRCEQHRKDHYRRDRKQRGTAAERGYDSKWQIRRKKHLRYHPLCHYCELNGRVKAGNTVDHGVPVTDRDDPLFWNEKDWRTTCPTCHNRKTQHDPEIRAFYDGGAPLHQALHHVDNLMRET